ncbi:MAG: 4Fe-4S dicluster domain-containing protein [Actinomycetota bacterium]|nr:4Fe-4S dicluster domain-containing protein [Actinomycetota bacterium]
MPVQPPLKVNPCFIEKKEDLNKLVFNQLCINNLASYAYKLSKQVKGNIGMVVKPCDSKAIAQLISEGLIERDRFKLIAVGCNGVMDYKKISRAVGGARVSGLDIGQDKIKVETAKESLELEKKDYYADKCYWCELWEKPPVYDEFLENEHKLDIEKRDRLADIKELEQMDLDQIFSYWQKEFDRCIRCYACRNICPMEICQDQCIVHLDFPNWQSQKVNTDENKFFQMIRVMHLAGRCVECGECERVCPQNISLHKLMKKMNQIIGQLFDFEAGMDMEAKPPLLTYNTLEKNIKEEEL